LLESLFELGCGAKANAARGRNRHRGVGARIETRTSLTSSYREGPEARNPKAFFFFDRVGDLIECFVDDSRDGLLGLTDFFSDCFDEIRLGNER
jgi:hypothetical protein